MMLLILHIVIALAGIGSSAYLFVHPTREVLRQTYTLVTGTLLSGTYLVISTSAKLSHACQSGLVYLAIVSVGIVYAHRKLAVAKNDSR